MHVLLLEIYATVSILVIYFMELERERGITIQVSSNRSLQKTPESIHVVPLINVVFCSIQC